jgi:hypothetical protein
LRERAVAVAAARFCRAQCVCIPLRIGGIARSAARFSASSLITASLLKGTAVEAEELDVALAAEEVAGAAAAALGSTGCSSFAEASSSPLPAVCRAKSASDGTLLPARLEAALWA